jgi:tetratricopeptide (TPR) repeat protein
MTQTARDRRALVAIVLAGAVLFSSSSASIASTQTDDVERAFAEATGLHQAGKVEAAIAGYLAILARNPERADVRSNLGAAYVGLGRYEEAIDQYKRALAGDSRKFRGKGGFGDYLAIRFNLGLAYYKANLFTEAAAELNRFVSEAPVTLPQRSSAMLVLADCQVRLGDYKRVIDLLSPLETADPGNRAVAYLLGSALVSDGQVKRGQELIDRVFRGEDTAEARLLIGSILLLADDGQAAIKELERAIELNPKLPSLRSWYGRALTRMGDSERAKEAFKAELKDNPNDFDANLYMGILLRRDKVADEALDYLLRARRLRPADAYARYHLGAVYTSLGRLSDALPLLEYVVKEHPDFIENRVLLASVYYRLNRKQDGDQQRAIVDKLNSEQQAKQPGSQEPATGHVKPPGEVKPIPQHPEEQH